MVAREGGGVAHVDDHRAVLHLLLEPVRVHGQIQGAALQKRRTARVGGDDVGEGLGPGREVLAHGQVELLEVVEAEHGVVPPLEAEGGAGLGGHAAPAQGARAVCREDLQAVGKLGELDVQGVPEVLDLLVELGPAHQVGPPDVVHEQHVAGQEHPRLVPARGVGDQQGQGVRGVAGGVQDLQLGVAHLQHLALLEGGEVVADRRGLVDHDVATGLGFQLLCPGHVIRVDVGVNDVDDLHALVAGDVQVVLHVALGINHDHLAGGGAADDVGEATESGCSYLLEIHRRSLWCSLLAMRRISTKGGRCNI